MSPILRVILAVVSIITTFYVIRKIRKSQMQIEDSVFWIVFSVILVILSIFPQLALWASVTIGIMSPANFVFVSIIFILLIKIFSLSLKLSQLELKIHTLAQKSAITEYENNQAGIDKVYK